MIIILLIIVLVVIAIAVKIGIDAGLRRRDEDSVSEEPTWEFEQPRHVRLLQELARPSELPPEREVDSYRVQVAIDRAEEGWLAIQKADVESSDPDTAARAREALSNPRILQEQRRKWRANAIAGEQKAMANDKAIQAFIDPPRKGPEERSPYTDEPAVQKVRYEPTEAEEAQRDRIIEDSSVDTSPTLDEVERAAKDFNATSGEVSTILDNSLTIDDPNFEG